MPPEIDNVRTSKPLTDQVYYVRRSVNSLAGKVVTVQVLYPVPNVGVPSDLCEQMAADYRKQSPDAKCIAPTAAQPEPAPQPRN